MRDKPSFWSFIPPSVRYDNTISSTAKIIYGEIGALANTQLYCWAHNKYFSELFCITDRQVGKLIDDLEKAGHISVERNNRAPNKDRRKIRVREKFAARVKPRHKVRTPHVDKVRDHIYNNTSINNNNTTYSKDSSSPSKLVEDSSSVIQESTKVSNSLNPKQLQCLCFLYFTLTKASDTVKKANFSRVMKDIKQLAVMGEQDYDTVKGKIEGGERYFSEKGLSWSTKAIIRQWDNIIVRGKITDKLEDW